MEDSEFHWQAKDGERLFAREWKPVGELRGAICYVHGMGEHSGRFKTIAQALNREGFAVMALDLRGHGRSGGRRGHASSLEVLLDDVEQMVIETSSRFSGVPLFLYGQSMGGNLVLNYAMRRRQTVLNGVIATSPWLRLAFEPPAMLLKIAGLLNLLFPRYTRSTGLEIKGLSRDNEIAKAYREDPLVHDRISIRMYMEITRAGQWAIKHAGEFNIPLLLMHGNADPITSSEASEDFAEAAHPCTTLMLWKGGFHEICNDLQKEDAIAYLIGWLKMQTGAERLNSRPAHSPDEHQVVSPA